MRLNLRDIEITISVLYVIISFLVPGQQSSRITSPFFFFFRILLDSHFSVSPKSVYYSFSCAQYPTGILLSNYLMSNILCWCWFARNRGSFRNSILSSNNILGLFKNDVRIRIRGDRPNSVRSFWSFRNALCSVDACDKISFFSLL